MDETSQIFTPIASINSRTSSPTNIGDNGDSISNQQQLRARTVGATRRISTMQETSQVSHRKKQSLAGNSQSQSRSSSVAETPAFPTEQQRLLASTIAGKLKRKITTETARQKFVLVAKSTISPINNSNSSLEFFTGGKIYDFHIKQQQQLVGIF